ncbi:MAG TPA: DUF2202 domain-containing protein [Acidimicrobiia bacterium]|nr:DUF2202 domain-containing protein [Acidimicrobiia bacterium]
MNDNAGFTKIWWKIGLTTALAFALLLGACSGQTTLQSSTTTPTDVGTAPTAGTAFVDDAGVTSVGAEEMKALLSRMPTSTLTAQQIDDLLWTREEEKLAHDVYSALNDKWQLPTFADIASAEQTHSDAIAQLLDRYNLDDPTDGEPAGVFSKTDLQKAYDQFLAQGSESLIAALTVGATIEEMGIFDLQQRATDAPDVALVYAFSQMASRNHLRAFVSVLTERGETYMPTYISQEEYDSIISSPIEHHLPS